jgi:hypothetical protein
MYVVKWFGSFFLPPLRFMYIALNRYRGTACGNRSGPNGALSPLLADLLRPMLLVVRDRAGERR